MRENLQQKKSYSHKSGDNYNLTSVNRNSVYVLSKLSSYITVTHRVFVTKSTMYSRIYKHINTFCELDAGVLVLNQMVHTAVTFVI